MSSEEVKVAKLPEEKEIPVNRIGTMKVRSVRYTHTRSLMINTGRECFLNANAPTQTAKEFEEENGFNYMPKRKFLGEWLAVKLTKAGLEVKMLGVGHEEYIEVDPDLSLKNAARKGFLPVTKLTRTKPKE